MAAPAACKICDTRRARRYCPGVGGDICPICCGTQREVTVNCPLDCAYLREARQRERVPEPDARDLPHKDLRITEDFLLANEKLLALAAGVVVQSALSTPAVVDFDVRAALASLIRTHETMQSGLYYDSRPTDVVAARLYDQMRSKLDRVREQATSAGES
ncbi:MAG TPA: hypothetical protein VEQ63_12660, partial [Bryobacteraceae bacterium]|nr:hypothetical protein [Bryobacteraceae bacterium]